MLGWVPHMSSKKLWVLLVGDFFYRPDTLSVCHPASSVKAQRNWCLSPF